MYLISTPTRRSCAEGVLAKAGLAEKESGEREEVPFDAAVVFASPLSRLSVSFSAPPRHDAPARTAAMNRPTRSSPGPLLIALAYVGFVSLGLPDAVIGVAWPTVRDTFRLHQGAVGIVFVASGFGYFMTSFLSGRFTQVLGIGLLLAASTGLVAAAMF